MNDIEIALRKYPALYVHMSPYGPIIEGSYTAKDKTGKIEIDTYKIRLGFPSNYPYAFPLVEETSRKIPRELDRHVRKNGTLCFSNPQDELGVCRKGITFKWFLDEILNAHLCREYVKEKTTKYPTGERSHDNEGIWEGYYEVFDTDNKQAILTQLELVLNHKPPGRNAPCYCNSGRKYKICHEKIESEILNVGRPNAIRIFELLKKDYNKQK